jgi:polysaccharide biosynthesis transport protein
MSERRLPPSPGSRRGDSRRPVDASAIEVREYLGILRRRWWLIVAAGLLALGGAWWAESGKMPVYTAEVLMEQQRQAPIMGVAMGGGGDFVSQIEVIRGRAVIADVVESLGLQIRPVTRVGERSRILAAVEVESAPTRGAYTLIARGGEVVLSAGVDGSAMARGGGAEWLEGPGFRLRVDDLTALEGEPFEFVIQDLQVAVETLQRRIRIEPGRSSQLVRVSFIDPDPVLAASVVNGVAGAYQTQRARMAREAASRRREVIASQLVGLADSLDQAQAAVVAYQSQARLLDPGFEGSQMLSSVLDTEGELRTLRFQEGLLESVLAGLQGEDPSDESVSRILSLGADLVPAGPGLYNRLQDLELERSRLTASRFGRLDSDPEVEVLDSQIATTRQQIRVAVEQALDLLRVRLTAAEDRLGDMRGDIQSIPGQTAELERLRQRANAVQDVVDQLVDRYYEAQIAEAVEAGDITVVDPATVPLWPNPSRARLNLILGLVAGLIVGMGVTLLIEYLNPRVRRADEAEEVTGLPLIGVIPRIGSPGRDPVGAAVGKEAFRSLRTNLRFAREQEPKLLAVTSHAPKQGKTTVAVNLATTLAEQGSTSVLLIDGDLRRPLIHRTFGLERGPGLCEVLNGTAVLGEAIRPSPVHPKLHVLTAGGPVPNPSAVTDSEAFSDLLDELKERFAFVVVDTPPVLAVTDGAVIAKKVDGTLVVIRADQADPVAVSHAMDQLRQIDASLLGVILNGVGESTSGGNYYHAYYDDYLSDQDSREAGAIGIRRSRSLLGTGTDR